LPLGRQATDLAGAGGKGTNLDARVSITPVANSA
jgi:hypothetical protein